MAGEFQNIPLLYPDFSTLVPNENPLSDSGRWSNDGDRPPLQAGGGPIVSDIHGTVEFVVNGSLYVEKALVGPIKEAFACTPNTDLGAALESQRVAMWSDPDGRTGYSIGWGGGIGESFFFRKYTNNAFIGIGGAHSTDDHPDKIGLRITPDREEAWGEYGGVWQLITYATDMAYRGPMWVALETEEQGGVNEVGFTCFGAGVPNRTQIYRVLKGV